MESSKDITPENKETVNPKDKDEAHGKAQPKRDHKRRSESDSEIEDRKRRRNKGSRRDQFHYRDPREEEMYWRYGSYNPPMAPYMPNHYGYYGSQFMPQYQYRVYQPAMRFPHHPHRAVDFEGQIYDSDVSTSSYSSSSSSSDRYEHDRRPQYARRGEVNPRVYDTKAPKKVGQHNFHLPSESHCTQPGHHVHGNATHRYQAPAPVPNYYQPQYNLHAPAPFYAGYAQPQPFQAANHFGGHHQARPHHADPRQADFHHARSYHADPRQPDFHHARSYHDDPRQAEAHFNQPRHVNEPRHYSDPRDRNARPQQYQAKPRPDQKNDKKAEKDDKAAPQEASKNENPNTHLPDLSVD